MGPPRRGLEDQARSQLRWANDFWSFDVSHCRVRRVARWIERPGGGSAAASASAGLSYVHVEHCDATSESCGTIGVPLVAEVILTPFDVIGIGLQLFANINPEASNGGRASARPDTPAVWRSRPCFALSCLEMGPAAVNGITSGDQRFTKRASIQSPIKSSASTAKVSSIPAYS